MDRKKKNIVELTRMGCDQYRAMEKYPLAVLADNVRSMYNIGSLFRVSDAFKVSEIILTGISGRPPHPEISKTALGAEETVSWRWEEDSVECVRRMQQAGWTVCVLEQTHNSIDLDDFTAEPGKKYLLVVGNEVNGVDQRIVDMADIVLEIPQYGTKHSLNVASSASIAIYSMVRKLEA